MASVLLFSLFVYAIIRNRSDDEGLAVLGTTSKTFLCTDALKADVNGDGKVNSVDPVIILQAAYKKRTLSTTQFNKADIDKDKVIGISDAVIAMRIAGGISCASSDSLSSTEDIPIISVTATGSFNCSRASRADFYTATSSVDSVDAVMIMQVAAGKRTFTNVRKSSADINGDGVVGIVDAVMALRIAAKISCNGVDMTNIAKNCVGGETKYLFKLSFYTSLVSANGDGDDHDGKAEYAYTPEGLNLGFPEHLKDVPTVPFYDFSRIVANNHWSAGKPIRMLGTSYFNGEKFYVLDRGGSSEFKNNNRFDVLVPRKKVNGVYETDAQYHSRVNAKGTPTVTGCIK